jgi:hypothetical protein
MDDDDMNRATANQFAQRSQIDIQVLVGEPESFAEGSYLLTLAHQGQPQALAISLAQAAGFDPCEGLSFEQFMQQVDQGQHQLREPVLELVGFQIDAPPALGPWRIAEQGFAESAIQRPRRRLVPRFSGRAAGGVNHRVPPRPS